VNITPDVIVAVIEPSVSVRLIVKEYVDII